MNEPTTQLDRMAHQVIGAALEVHRQLGPGFMESIYEEAMLLELAFRSVTVERQVAVPIRYKGQQIGTNRIDLLVDGDLVVELKAVESIERVHFAQVRSYLKAAGCLLGLLINFNVPVLREGIRRVIWSG